MLKRLCSAAFTVIVLALAHGSARAKILSLGDPAPSITVGKFVKGEPVAKFEKGKLYVVEFWATWCPPCKKSIPHLTELQKQYKDVTFIGVSVFENSQADVEPFVSSMGAKMNYRVAMDSIPTGKAADAGVMVNSWMVAANRDTIPTAFIVDKESKIAWIGRPMEVEEPLAKLVAGKWDLKTALEDAAHRKSKEAAMVELDGKLDLLLEKKEVSGALTLMNATLLVHPELEERESLQKFLLLILTHNDADAVAYGNKLLLYTLHNKADELSSLAWSVVNPEHAVRIAPTVLEVAVKAAKRADELYKGEDASISDTLAWAYFAAGKKELAISTEERAIKVNTDAAMAPDLKKALEKFKK